MSDNATVLSPHIPTANQRPVFGSREQCTANQRLVFRLHDDHVTVLYSASSSSQSETSIWGHVNNIQPIRDRYLGYCDHVSVLYNVYLTGHNKTNVLEKCQNTRYIFYTPK